MRVGVGVGVGRVVGGDGCAGCSSSWASVAVSVSHQRQLALVVQRVMVHSRQHLAQDRI